MYLFFLTSCEMKKLGPHMRKQKQNQVNKLTVTFTVRYLCLININERCCSGMMLQIRTTAGRSLRTSCWI